MHRYTATSGPMAHGIPDPEYYFALPRERIILEIRGRPSVVAYLASVGRSVDAFADWISSQQQGADAFPNGNLQYAEDYAAASYNNARMQYDNHQGLQHPDLPRGTQFGGGGPGKPSDSKYPGESTPTKTASECASSPRRDRTPPGTRSRRSEAGKGNILANLVLPYLGFSYHSVAPCNAARDI